MTRSTNARIAGCAYLAYMVVGGASHALMTRATTAEGTAATLARIAGHAAEVRTSILLQLFECFLAVVLAVTLYAITRVQNREIAMVAMASRVSEGLLGVTGIQQTLGLLWLATAGIGPDAPDAGTTKALGTLLLMPVPSLPIGAIFFAVGSTLFSYLLLRGRMIPVLLASFGVLASGLLAVGLPLQLAGFLGKSVAAHLWIPVVVYQIPLGLWLLIKGVADEGQAG